MYNLLLIVIMVVAILLILIVLVQNPKGGGLSSSITGGAAGGSIGGVQSTNNFLDKATWTLAIALLVLILSSSLLIPRDGSNKSELQNTIQQREQVAPVEDESANVEDLLNNSEAPAEETTEE